MSGETTIIETRIAKATAEITKRFTVEPEALHWEVSGEQASCTFTDGRHGLDYIARVGIGKNVVEVYQRTRQLNLS